MAPHGLASRQQRHWRAVAIHHCQSIFRLAAYEALSVFAPAQRRVIRFASGSNNDRTNSPIEKTVLDNGLTIISEQMSHVRSASVGIWVRSGSRHEDGAA